MPDPTSDGERCTGCERLLFPEQRDVGLCGECPASDHAVDLSEA